MGTLHNIRDGLFNLINALGTSKDARTQSQYGYTQIDRTQLEAAFRSDWIARAVVMSPAEDATREWREWQASQDQIEKIENEEKRLDLKRKLRRAIMQARLYGGSCIVLGTTDGKADQPLDVESIGLAGLKWIAVFHMFEMSPGQLITDIESPWFNRPEYYRVGAYVTNLDGDNSVAPNTTIHPSRVIVIKGNELPDERTVGVAQWGDSVLQCVDDAIKSTQSVIGGVASMVVDAKLDIINVPGLTKALSDPVAGPKLINRFTVANQAKSSVNALLLDKDEEWQRIETSFGSLPQLIQEYLTVAAGAARIPVSRLLGMAKGKGIGGTEGGGEVDTRNYYDGISAFQKNDLGPTLAPLDEAIICSALGSPDETVFYNWAPLWQMSDAEKATIALQKAQASQADVTMALINQDALRDARVNQLIEDGTYPGLQDAIDEHGAEPPEPATPSPEDVQAHIGMMQKSAGQLQSISKTAGLLPPPKPTTDSVPFSRWLEGDD